MQADLPTRRSVAAALSAAVAAGAGWLLYDDARQSHASARRSLELQADIERRGGFRVVMDDLQAQLGPSVIMPDRPVTLTDLGSARLGPLRSLAAGLAPYPPGFVARFIDTVALAGDIVFWNSTAVGGYFFPRGLCINAGHPGDEGVATTRLFHHELSSLVRLGGPFDDTRWQSFNPPDFSYLDESAYRALLRSPHATGDPTLYARGFVRPYGESDLDNDWNTYAEEAFGDGLAFSRVIRPYPRMRAKTGMLVETYQAMDKAIARYFDETGLRSAVGAG